MTAIIQNTSKFHLHTVSAMLVHIMSIINAMTYLACTL